MRINGDLTITPKNMNDYPNLEYVEGLLKIIDAPEFNLKNLEYCGGLEIIENQKTIVRLK